MAAFFESEFKGHKGNLVTQWMISFSNFHCRGTLNQKATIKSKFLSCKLSGRSMAVKWVAMMKKKWTDFLKNSCGWCQLDQQATAQTALKLHVCIIPTQRFYACDMKGESFRGSEICHADFKNDVIFLKIVKPFCHVNDSQKWSRFLVGRALCAFLALRLITVSLDLSD